MRINSYKLQSYLCTVLNKLSKPNLVFLDFSADRLTDNLRGILYVRMQGLTAHSATFTIKAKQNARQSNEI